jgi:lipid II isoglutaminyl synthase (glutamine-hydrolysing)
VDDSGREWNLFARQSVRIAAAVEALVVMADRRHRVGDKADVLDHASALGRVAAHEDPLLLCETAWLEQDLLRDRNLPDVVQKRGLAQCTQRASTEAELRAERHGELPHTLRVCSGVGVLRINGREALEHAGFVSHPALIRARERNASPDRVIAHLEYRSPIGALCERTAPRLDLMRLQAEVALARAAGRLSRLVGRGGGTTLPGKILTSLDSQAVGRLAVRLPLGTALVSATNGKTTTTAMAAGILQGGARLAHNRAGANLASGIASALMEAPNAELALLEVDEGAFSSIAEQTRPRAVLLCNLFRDQLDRYGELELVAERWRRAVATLDQTSVVVVNADDPLLAELASSRENVVRFGVDDPTVARERLPHAADSKYCVRCGQPLAYRAAYVGHLGDYGCPACHVSRPSLDVAARAIQPDGLAGTAFDLETPDGTARVELALPGLYNVYNAVAASALCLQLGATLEEVAAGLGRFRAAFGRFERFRAEDRDVLMLLIKNPAGANEAIRTLVGGGAHRVAVVALNDEIADGRDVSWIWDVDFEPLCGSLEHLVAAGRRAEEVALRFKYAGFDGGRIEVMPDLARALDRGLELVPPGDELAVLPTYTAMLMLRDVAAQRGLVRPYWEAAPA